MNLGLLLLPVLGGYLFLTRTYFTRYNAIRDSGYHLFFRSAAAGFLLGMVAHLLLFFLDECFPPIRKSWKPHLPSEYDDTAILSLALGFVLPFLFNLLGLLGRAFDRRGLALGFVLPFLFNDREKAAQQAARRRGGFIELLIADSRTRGKLVEFSLRSGKSYIGFTSGFSIEGGIVRRDESDVALIPMASGYRDNDTKELKITTYYAPVIQEWLEENEPDSSGNDFEIVFPISEIVSARIFLPEALPLFRQTDPSLREPIDKG